MLNRLKASPIAWLLLLNSVSLAVGGWICWRIANAMATDLVRQEDRREITALATELMPRFAALRVTDFESGSPPPPLYSLLTASPSDTHGLFKSIGVLVLDSESGIVFASEDSLLEGSSSFQTERRSSEYLEGADASTTSGLEPGILDTSGQSLSAVSCSLAHGDGRIVFYRTATTAEGCYWKTWPKSLQTALVVAFVWTIGLQVLATFLVLPPKKEKDHLEQHSQREQQLKHNLDLVRTRDAVIFGLAKLAESRDPDTGQHLERISEYSSCLAAALRCAPQFRGQVSGQFVESIGISSALHDIGKVAVRDAVLLKAGKLNDAELEHMRSHARIGGDCLQGVEQRLGSSNFLAMAREIAASHHEWWDGSGYPRGLAGEAIPLAARIVAIADVYDALSVERPYKPAYPHEYCVKYILQQAGTQFDPRIVKVFAKITDQFRDIGRAYPSHPHPTGTELQQVDSEDEVMQLAMAIEEIATDLKQMDGTSDEPDQPSSLLGAASICSTHSTTKGQLDV